MEKNDADAVKLLAEWSKWLASLQTGVITLLGVVVASEKVNISSNAHPGLLVAGVICFVVSLLSASFLLFALPGVLQRLPPPPNKDFFAMGTFNGGGIRVVVFAVVEFVGFGLGIVLMAIWAISQTTKG